MEMKKISIGVPCYNEEENIELMYGTLTEQMRNFSQYDYEIIFEDNASTDTSEQILRKIAQQDKHVKVILNQSNFGPERSSTNCMGSMTGDAFISLPCDFQEPPEMIPEFLKYWEEGYSVVLGQKTKSKENRFKYFLRKVYYKIINAFSDHPQIDQVTGFGIYDRKIADILMITKSQDPFVEVRHLLSEHHFKMKLLPYSQRQRQHGKSSYTTWSYFSFAITSLCNTSVKPLRIMTVLGLVTGFLSLLCGGVYLVYKLLYWDTFSAGMAPLVIGLFFCASVQLFCIGMLGEYIGIILRKVTDKPLVIEKERINFEEEK